MYDDSKYTKYLTFGSQHAFQNTYSCCILNLNIQNFEDKEMDKENSCQGKLTPTRLMFKV